MVACRVTGSSPLSQFSEPPNQRGIALSKGHQETVTAVPGVARLVEISHGGAVLVRHGTTWQDEAGPGEANKKGLLPPFCFMWPRPRNRIVVSHRTATAFAIRNPVAAPALPRQCISAFGILRPSAPAVSRARSRAAAPRSQAPIERPVPRFPR